MATTERTILVDGGETCFTAWVVGARVDKSGKFTVTLEIDAATKYQAMMLTDQAGLPFKFVASFAPVNIEDYMPSGSMEVDAGDDDDDGDDDDADFYDADDEDDD